MPAAGTTPTFGFGPEDIYVCHRCGSIVLVGEAVKHARFHEPVDMSRDEPMSDRERRIASEAWYEGVADTGCDESLINARNPYDYPARTSHSQGNADGR